MFMLKWRRGNGPKKPKTRIFYNTLNDRDQMQVNKQFVSLKGLEF